MFNKERAKARFEETKAKASVKMSQAVNWSKENPQLAIGIGLLATKVLWEAGRASKRRQLDRMEQQKQLTVYDPSLDTRWELRHKMSNREALEFKQRLESGQSRGEALEAMRLLK